MPKAFPIEFRNEVVAVARKREAPVSQIAKDFGASESSLHRWLKMAEVKDGGPSWDDGRRVDRTGGAEEAQPAVGARE